MKLPEFPEKMTRISLTDGFLQSYEEYREMRIIGGRSAGNQVEHTTFEAVQFQDVSFIECRLYAPRLRHVRFKSSSLANANCEQLIAHRSEFADCQLVGLNVTKGHLQDVRFRECNLQFSLFRFCSFKSVRFEDCDLRDVNFQGADLSGTRFIRCDLSNAQLSAAKLAGTDFRTSKIEGLRVGRDEVVGAIVDPFQAAYMAGLLGLIVKNEDEA